MIPIVVTRNIYNLYVEKYIVSRDCSPVESNGPSLPVKKPQKIHLPYLRSVHVKTNVRFNPLPREPFSCKTYEYTANIRIRDCKRDSYDLIRLGC